ncbi:MAG TPA: Ig-like domain-containing protein [bacterium]|nr:Ig-like domain-containing protein [bacterium]
MISLKKRHLITAIIFAMIVGFAFSVAEKAWAQTNSADPNVLWGANYSAETFRNIVGLGDQDPRLVVAKIIRAALGFLGIIAIGLILYAGFIWMTSGGNDEKISKAKGILKNAAIGLLIILASFGIVAFIIGQLGGATFHGGGGGGGGNGGGGVVGLGNGVVKRVYPEPFQKDVPRNTSIIVTFREPMKAATICTDITSGGLCAPGTKILASSVRIFRTEDIIISPLTEVVVTSTDNTTFIFQPAAPAYLGGENQTVNYSVNLTTDIKKANGSNAFSLSTGFTWGFEVSNELDLISPQIREFDKGGIFPQPDDEKDIISGTSSPTAAHATLTVNSLPSFYTGATAIISRTAPLSFPLKARVEGTNSCAVGTVSISIFDSSGTLKARVGYSQSGLVSADLNILSNRFTIAPCGLTVILEPGYVAGHSWQIAVTPVVQADTLTIGSKIYTFVNSTPNNNQIQVGASVGATATHISESVNTIHPEVTATVAGSIVTLKAKIAGLSGNRLELSSSNAVAFGLAAFSEGADEVTTYTPRDITDQPKNSIIQINFNESINPLTISGTSEEVAEKLRVVNAASGAKLGGQPCGADNECRSYKCSTGTCQGDQLAGTFVVSNQYKTTEFVSDIKCGVNGCGENIYCLPGNSNLRVEVAAASLIACASDTDCTIAPFNTCDRTTRVCKDGIEDKNYPIASSIDGIIDASNNSLDGNRNENAQGKTTVWNENLTDRDNGDNGDNYQWSFWVSDRLDLSTPKIELTTHSNNESGVHLSNAIEILFSKLMMSSSLNSGSVVINNGLETITHHLINLWSVATDPVGYWLSKEDIDTPPLDGRADKSKAILGHGMFKDSTAYRTQVGSGVKDIYQNCFKPSVGPNCVANSLNPSCCRNSDGDLVPTDSLTAEGNCRL